MRFLRVLVLVPLCATGCATYSIRRAALTPNPAPVTRDGQPMASPFEIAVGTASLARVSAPQTGDDPNEGLVVPRFDLNGGIRARIGRNFDVGFLFDNGFNGGAEMTAPDMPRPSGDVTGYGVSVHGSLGEGDFRVGLELDALVYDIPWTETWTCVDDCGSDPEPLTHVRSGHAQTGVVALGVIPSWRVGPWVLFGSATARNHPTIAKGSVQKIEIDDPVDAGPVNLVVAAGAELMLAGGARVAMQAYLPLSNDPVKYAPTLAASLIMGFGP